ncbi:MAG: YfdX family protein [Candidatus Competibacteraceae bacterium]|nr:YfdX family protein [Candidatus Competibacteraceae bacterium]MCP5132928.1 YfdX family protein [Gammaproteobacteria bacterium]
MKLVDQAKMALTAATKDVDKLAIKPQKNDMGPMVPIDARLTIADDFVLNPEKKEQMNKVNEHLKKGETRKAIEVLGPADESMTLTTLFMPLEAMSKAVDEAATLLAGNKYYEANLALKNAEDGWVTESQSFVDYLAALPKPEKAMNSPKPEKAASSPEPEKAANKPSS